jgi:precorrin-6A/cobalt-precorrin-6A reductase
MKILILGGIGEAVTLAQNCISLSQRNSAIQVIYSLAGRARISALDCEVLVGGFGGPEGIKNYLLNNGISLVVDVTHPYASTISRHVSLACDQTATPLFRYLRDSWSVSDKDQWLDVASEIELIQTVSLYNRPFFTIGGSALGLLDKRSEYPLASQHWLIRLIQTNQSKLDDPVSLAKRLKTCTVINEIGPFSVSHEQTLMEKYDIDVLVAKNSGGTAVYPKIIAARNLGIPVIMVKRPKIPAIAAQFSDLSELFTRIACVVDHPAPVFS